MHDIITDIDLRVLPHPSKLMLIACTLNFHSCVVAVSAHAELLCYFNFQVIGKLHMACLLYDNWKKENKPQYKPWLFPEQSILPYLEQGDIVAMKTSATDPDLLGESEATEDQVGDEYEQ